MHRLLSIPALLTLLAATCGESAPAPDAEGERAVDLPNVPYALATPSASFDLPADLREISDLTVLADSTLGAVQDEDGLLFSLDPATGAVRSQTAFKERGDFEGVERVGDDVWALESNGTLYRIERGEGEVEAERVETGLAGRNDTEGLAYDAARNRLLIACKENPGTGLGSVRAVYAFDLATRTLSAAPVFTLDRQLVDAEQSFKPSAIAIRPGTGEFYVLSSVRKAIAVVAPDGTLRTLIDLPEALYAQPEGLTFLPDGTLFISNEGPDGPATLLRFDPTDR